jgi:hypothetical protein
MRVWLWVLLFTLMTTRLSANERVDICAKYVNTGQTYHVHAIDTTGVELNTATGTFNYNVLDHYIVIFWAQHQATIIDMEGLFFGPTPLASTGTDQENREWEITSYSGLCF